MWVLRDSLGLTGTKYGCGLGQCGACTVNLNGRAARACVTPISEVGSAPVTTIEETATTAVGTQLLAAWIAEDVPQCGYCQPGQVMAAAALLARTPRPTSEQIDSAMSGNLCRCGTYPRIKRAITRAARST
jgi:aerobic-type carbon monoxide dehydrogenase small subunit (CoxS/CutS family)